MSDWGFGHGIASANPNLQSLITNPNPELPNTPEFEYTLLRYHSYNRLNSRETQSWAENHA